MATKKDDKSDKAEKAETENQTTDGQGNVLKPGTVVPAVQDPELAEKGIYQPADQAANAPADDPAPKESDEQAEHRKNLEHLPPVPSERAGAASQAK